MKLFEGALKSTGEMTDEELANLITMLRQMRATSLTQATRAVKTRGKKEGGTKRIPKTIDLKSVRALLTPEQQALFDQAIAGKI